MACVCPNMQLQPDLSQSAQLTHTKAFKSLALAAFPPSQGLRVRSPDMRAFSHLLTLLPLTACSCTALSNDCFRLEHFVLSVCHVPSYCLLTPLMSPKDRESKLID